MNRRGFLGALLAAAAAPAIARASSLMPIYVPRLLTLWGDGVHDDTEALQAIFDGKPVSFGGGTYEPGGAGSILLPSGDFRITDSLQMRSHTTYSGYGSRIIKEGEGAALNVGRDVRDLTMQGFRFEMEDQRRSVAIEFGRGR